MANTAACIEAIKEVDLVLFKSLITNRVDTWKRVSKFGYRNGTRRYFYLINSCLIATVDEIAGRLYTVVRPPMLWELYMLSDLRPNDNFLMDEVHEIYDEHYDFITDFAAKYSEAEQYNFMIGDDDGVAWLFFQPIHSKKPYDQHLGGDLYDLLPDWLRDNEEAECSYSAFGNEEKTEEEIKQELINLGFVYNDAEI